jgi:hypothetical protein
MDLGEVGWGDVDWIKKNTIHAQQELEAYRVVRY